MCGRRIVGAVANATNRDAAGAVAGSESLVSMKGVTVDGPSSATRHGCVVASRSPMNRMHEFSRAVLARGIALRRVSASDRAQRSLGTMYTASAGVWCVAASVMAAAGLLQTALARSPGASVFAVGRLHEAFVIAMVFGAVSLAPAGVLLAACRDGNDRPAAWGLRAWNAGILVGVVAVLSGHGGPVTWQAGPALAMLLILGGVVGWSVSVWAEAGRTEHRGGLPPWLGLAVVAVLATPVYLAVLVMAVSRLGGVPQELATTVGIRGYFALGVLPMLWACAAMRLPVAAGRDLYGRAVPLTAFVAWIALAGIGTAAPAVPDLAPRWLDPLSSAAAALGAIPVAILSTALVGTWIGRRRGPPDVQAVLITIGLLAVAAALIADALLAGVPRELVRFSSWDPWAGLFPPLAGVTLLAMAVSVHGAPGRSMIKWVAVVAVAAALLGAAPLWPLGLTEAVTGPAADTDRLAAAVRLPWAFMLAAGALAWLGAAAGGAPTSGESAISAGAAPIPLAGTDRWLRRGPFAGLTTLAVAVGLFLTVFLPIADPSAFEPTARTAARLLADPARARGSAVYTRDGCAACHTQRVLPGDAARGLGPITQRGDYPVRFPAHAGGRRGGPDLAWVGDRYPTQDEMAARLAVHAPGRGATQHPWLFSPDAGQDGDALVVYLLGLSARPTQP